MSTLRLKLIFKDTVIMRFWSAWTRKGGVRSVVKRCIRERGFREVIQVFKHTILRPRRTLFLAAAAYKTHNVSFSCDQGISDEELQALLLDIENAQNLAKSTLHCAGCGARRVINRKQDGVIYCICKEPQTESVGSDGWVPYVEAQDVIIWRKEYKPGGLFAYKVYGRYPEVAASDYAAVNIDGAYRWVWDSAVAALAVVQRNARGISGQAILHWEVLWPRLFANRDYVFIRRHKEFDIVTDKITDEAVLGNQTNAGSNTKRSSSQSYKCLEDDKINNKMYVIMSKSCEHPDVPETKHAIRVAEYWSHMVVKTTDGDDKPGMEFVLTYYDEPAVGGMPGGVAAWASSRAAPVYLERMRRAAGEYRDWVRGRAGQEVPDFIPFEPENVNREHLVQIQEQDMETSRQGPDMENGVATKDQSSQVDEFIIQNLNTDNENITEKQNTDTAKVQIGKDLLNKNKGECPESGNRERSTLEGDSDKLEEGENNGGWWRYLYPFYYFI